CAVRDGIDGISLDSADVDLKHSIVKNNSDRGIYNYQGILTADSCKIENNGYYGLYSHKAVSIIDSCHFRANENYAIYCYVPPASGNRTIINNCLIDNTGNDVIPYGSQYGIFSGIDQVRITNCLIREYDQGGIKLSSSDAIVTNNQIRRHGNYGIYISYISQTPYIRNCNFDSLSVGITIGAKAYPDLGDMTSSPPDTGYSDFENCSSYYIYKINFGLDSVKAEGNYYGGVPSSSKFYGNVDYRPWLRSDPFPKFHVNSNSPSEFKLYSSFPNPFNPTTNISFALDKPGHTVLCIYNLLGQRVTTLMNEYLNAGQYSVVWNGRNSLGVQVSSGVYFYTVESGDRFDSKKMLLLR
ncbi:MAG: right-handed parallel beta-helix repeat-containing protein, partial [candidate division Zixibacteria bacterium]